MVIFIRYSHWFTRFSTVFSVFSPEVDRICSTHSIGRELRLQPVNLHRGRGAMTAMKIAGQLSFQEISRTWRLDGKYWKITQVDDLSILFRWKFHGISKHV